LGTVKKELHKVSKMHLIAQVGLQWVVGLSSCNVKYDQFTYRLLKSYFDPVIQIEPVDLKGL